MITISLLTDTFSGFINHWREKSVKLQLISVPDLSICDWAIQTGSERNNIIIDRTWQKKTHFFYKKLEVWFFELHTHTLSQTHIDAETSLKIHLNFVLLGLAIIFVFGNDDDNDDDPLSINVLWETKHFVGLFLAPFWPSLMAGRHKRLWNETRSTQIRLWIRRNTTKTHILHLPLYLYIYICLWCLIVVPNRTDPGVEKNPKQRGRGFRILVCRRED